MNRINTLVFSVLLCIGFFVSLSQAETLLRGSKDIESLIEGDAVSHGPEGTEFGHEINELEEVDPEHHYARIEEDEPERARQLGHHRGRRFGKHSKYLLNIFKKFELIIR